MFRLPLVVVLDNVRSLYNTGAFYRTADACAIERLVLTGITPRPDQGGKQARAIAKTALGAEDVVPWSYERDIVTALEPLRSAGYQIAAAEPAADAIDFFEWEPRWPVCLVFGHERTGVSSAASPFIDRHVRIPMFGEKRSLNVATAGGVAMYELLRRYRSRLNA
jgi:23S rRNA (guanosine2251-2'-O)-methyltransferase